MTAEELILCRETDLILHCSLLPRHQDRNREQGGERSQASLWKPWLWCPATHEHWAVGAAWALLSFPKQLSDL